MLKRSKQKRSTAVIGWLTDKFGRILVVIHDRGLELPGGHVEEGETFKKALKREVMEEAAYSCSPERELMTISDDVGDVRVWVGTCSQVRATVTDPRIHGHVLVPVRVAEKWFPSVAAALRREAEYHSEVQEAEDRVSKGRIPWGGVK